MISELKWTKRARIAVVVLCVVLGTAGLVTLSQMNQVAEAAILTPVESPPETIFYDDFSGDLGAWTIVSGTWGIESGELSQNGTLQFPNCIAGSAWASYTVEAKIKNINSTAVGLIARYVDENNYVATYYYFTGSSKDKIAVYEKLSGIWYLRASSAFAKTANNNTWYALKVLLNEDQIKVYLDTNLIITTSIAAVSGKIGLTSYLGHAHFDDVEVSMSTVPSAYKVNVRAGATKIVITCTWSGSGNISIANLTSPTGTTYYESNMSIYERSTTSVEAGATSILNIKRATLSIAATVSPETWTLNLCLSDVTTYQVSVEIS